jgi:hypothetical protein
MKPILTYSVVAMLATTHAEESTRDAVVIELRETISKIVDVQSQTSKELRDWESRKSAMDGLLEIHRRELSLLNEELEKSGQSAGGEDEAKQAAKAEIETLRAVRRDSTEAVARNIPRALAIAKRFPAPLLDECLPEITTLQNWKSGEEPREALQSILSVIEKAIRFNRRVTRNLEVRDGREVEVLYLGLARAYYADRSKNAGVGMPGTDGWIWTANPDLNSEILKAFEILDQKSPPARLKLPVAID